MGVTSIIYWVFLAGVAYTAYLVLSYFFCRYFYSEIPIVKYHISGKEDGKPLVFIHGWPGRYYSSLLLKITDHDESILSQISHQDGINKLNILKKIICA